MGTNYHRIPTVAELEKRKQLLLSRVRLMDTSIAGVGQGFGIDNPDGWDRVTPWDEFTDDVYIHLGKRSMGWKFCWNFHKNKYYSDKATLEAFVRSGRVIDEYGEEISPDDFLEMAYDWGQPDGWVHNEEYERAQGGHQWGPAYYDLEIDGLRVSTSTDFS
jgi:hypothetical protein